MHLLHIRIISTTSPLIHRDVLLQLHSVGQYNQYFSWKCLYIELVASALHCFFHKLSCLCSGCVGAGQTWLGTIHKHLLRWPDAKRRPLKFLTLVKGTLKKITTNFPVKIEFTCFSMGLTCNFHGIKEGPWNFWRSGGGGQKNLAIFFFFIRPLLQVFVNSPLWP